jgi:hypothetical protein
MSKVGARWGAGVLIAAVIAALLSYPFWSDAPIPTHSLQKSAADGRDESVAVDAAPDLRRESPASDASTGESPSVQMLSQHADWVRALVAELIRRGDAESLVGAAMLMHSHPTYFIGPNEKRNDYLQRYLDLIKQAAAQAPTDASIQRLALAFCQGTAAQMPDCDPSTYDVALRVLDPNNAASWLGALAQANSLIDANGQLAVLNRMGQARRFDDHRDGIDALVARAISSARVTPPSAVRGASRPIDDLSNGATRNIPAMSLTPLFKVCVSSPSDAVSAQCRRVTALLRASDNLGLVNSGLAIEKRMPSLGTADIQEVTDAQRRLDWQMEQGLELIRSHVEPSQRMQAIYDKQDLQALLRENGIPLDPPEDWKRP